MRPQSLAPGQKNLQSDRKKSMRTMRTTTRQAARRANASDDALSSGVGQGNGLWTGGRTALCGLWITSGLLWCTIAAALPGSPWPPLPSFTEVLLKLDFDDAYYQSTNYYDTVATDYGLLVSSWSGYALDRSTGTLLVPYLIPGVETIGKTNKTNIASAANSAAF